MFPTEIEIHQHRKDLQREAEQHRLRQSAREPRPSLVERIATRLSAFQVRSAAVDVGTTAKQPCEAVEAIA